MSLISKFNKGIKYLLCVIGLFSKYAWVAPLKDKKTVNIVNAFQSVLNSSENQTKYGQIMVVNFTTMFLKNG